MQTGQDGVVRFFPINPDEDYYRERTDRNIGWITRNEQEILRHSTIGIAGCGGMGGLLASIFVRLGVGEVRIADSETFDVSNINRQFAAKRGTVGKSKAIETARDVRAISDDSTLIAYPQGINETIVDEFLAGCDVVCDEIELLALDARILLHQHARTAGVPIINCNTVGFSTYLFLYTPDGMKVEELLGITYEEAKKLRGEALSGNREAHSRIANNIMRAVIPEVPPYSPEIVHAAKRRVLEEGKAPIIAPNPIMAGGFLADRVLLYLLRNSGVERNIVHMPPMPGYLYFDAAFVQAKVVTDWRP